MTEKELGMYIGGKIKRFRKNAKMTQGELGKLLGVKNNTISAYERGAISTDQDVLFRLGDIFGVSINEFFPPNNHVNRPDDEHLTNANQYDYFPTAISAGLPLEVDGITESKKITVSGEFLGRWKSNKDIFFAHVNGDSMNRLMDDGSLIAIKPINSIDELKNGDIVVYSTNGDYSVKHYFKYGDTLVFKPNSTTEHEEHEYNINDDIKIHGIVVTYVVNR